MNFLIYAGCFSLILFFSLSRYILQFSSPKMQFSCYDHNKDEAMMPKKVTHCGTSFVESRKMRISLCRRYHSFRSRYDRAICIINNQKLTRTVTPFFHTNHAYQSSSWTSQWFNNSFIIAFLSCESLSTTSDDCFFYNFLQSHCRCRMSSTWWVEFILRE